MTAATIAIAAGVASGSSLSSRVGPLIAQYRANTEDRQFASFHTNLWVDLGTSPIRCPILASWPLSGKSRFARKGKIS